MTRPVTAAVLVIGDEILSGRTKDKNIGYIADYLTAVGIDLKEVRVVPDEENEIVAAVNALRARYDYVFSTGGIGPTHDDITADAMAKAFGVPIGEDPHAIALLRERFSEADLNAARRRMARIPQGAELVTNRISKAPGFWIGNVIVMAGVPSIMQAMMDEVGPKLRAGAKVHALTLDTGGRPEGDYATALAEAAQAHPGVAIGSYPSFKEGGGFKNQIVLRGRDLAAVEAAARAVREMLARL
jgi:molybdenum cofactor synthesis domain-containing protein